jgi:quercetin dioxygenase-like cupin family protein
MLNGIGQKEWNGDSIIVPSYKNEKFESHGNKLKVTVSTTLTNNQFGLYEIEMEPKARGPKLHYHKLMEETFIVNEGTLSVLTDNGESYVEAGTIIYIPRLAAHGYNNDSDNIVKMTMIFTPGYNREQFFRKMYQMLDETPNDLEAFQKLYVDYDSYSISNENMIPMRVTNKSI